MSREGYKITEFGEIPLEWEVKKIEDLCTVRSDKFNPLSNESERYIALEHIESGKGRLLEVAESEGTTSVKSVFKKKDVLFGKLRPYLRKYWFAKFDGVCATEILPLVAKDRYESRYLYYVIQQDKFIDYTVQGSFGTKMPRTSWGEIKEFLQPIPHLLEQQKIADILSTVDEQIEQTDALINKTKELKKGLMQRLLTKGIGHTEFKDTEIGEIPVGWEVRRLGDLFKVSSGNFLSQKNIILGEYPVYGGNGVTGYHNEYIFEEPKIVIGRVGAKCGCVCMSQPKSWITDNALFIDKKYEEFYDTFMLFLLELLDLNKYANQTAQPVISGQKIYDIVVGIASTEEQKRIADIIGMINTTIEQYVLKGEELKVSKAALMQQLLTGKIRVKV